jgi:hypothetical protein
MGLIMLFERRLSQALTVLSESVRTDNYYYRVFFVVANKEYFLDDHIEVMRLLLRAPEGSYGSVTTYLDFGDKTQFSGAPEGDRTEWYQNAAIEWFGWMMMPSDGVADEKRMLKPGELSLSHDFDAEYLGSDQFYEHPLYGEQPPPSGLAKIIPYKERRSFPASQDKSSLGHQSQDVHAIRAPTSDWFG